MITLSFQLSAAELPAFMAQLAKSGTKVEVNSTAASDGKKAKKPKKEKDPNAPKKEANAWVLFTQHVRGVLLAGGCELKGFVGQQYCSVLKAKLPLLDANEKGKQEPDYSAISDEDILDGFQSWTPPEQSKAAAERSSKASSDAGSVASASETEAPVAPAAPAEKKARKPQSDETKAKAAEKRAATKAAKAAGGEVIPARPAGPKPATAAVPKPVAATPPAVEQENDVTEFAATIIKGKPYLRNCRGDLMTEEYEWVGRYNEKTKLIDTKFPQPEDLME